MAHSYFASVSEFQTTLMSSKSSIFSQYSPLSLQCQTPLFLYGCLLWPLQYKTALCLNHLSATAFLPHSNEWAESHIFQPQSPAGTEHNAAVAQQAYV